MPPSLCAAIQGVFGDMGGRQQAAVRVWGLDGHGGPWQPWGSGTMGPRSLQPPWLLRLSGTGHCQDKRARCPPVRSLSVWDSSQDSKAWERAVQPYVPVTPEPFLKLCFATTFCRGRAVAGTLSAECRWKRKHD